MGAWSSAHELTLTWHNISQATLAFMFRNLRGCGSKGDVTGRSAGHLVTARSERNSV